MRAINTNEVQPSVRAMLKHTRTWSGADVASAFASARTSYPWTLAYANVDTEPGRSPALQVDGRIPEDIRGVVYRNGPARHELAGERYAHRWDGDGMVQAFSLENGRVTHLARFVQTRKFQQESQAGRFLCNAFGSYRAGSDPLPADIDDWNPANINVAMCGGELLALWEAGSAYRLDPTSLETLGVKHWGEFQGRAFSAHPKREPDGTLWNFGCEPLTGLLNIYCVNADGSLRSAQQIQIPGLPNVHDFAVTERHLVFLLPPIPINEAKLRAGASFAQACEWKPELGTRALVIDKSNYRQRWYELPPSCIFHISNAWTDANETIRLEFVGARSPLALMAGWSIMAGQYAHREGGLLFRVELRSDGSFVREPFDDIEGEFPTVASSRVGRRHTQVLMPTRSATRESAVPGYDTLTMVDVATCRTSSYCFGSEWQVEEHLFVDGEAQGALDGQWVIGTALNMRRSQSALTIFSANDISAGPVATAWLPFSLPLGLHGTFVGARHM